MSITSANSGSSLSPPQKEVLDSGILASGFSCLIQSPTGSGKTWLAERAMADVLSGGKRAVYLAPLRALADELAVRWRERFAPSVVGVFTGDHGRAGKGYPVPFQDALVLVMTPERLDACTRAWRSHWSWLPEVDLVVADEFHLLGDRHRGGRLEGTLSRLQRLNPFARVLGLSATLGNRHELDDWLGGVEHGSDWRPVPLRWRVARYRKATEKPNILAEHVARNVREGGKSLVFVQSRRRAEELGRFLRDRGFSADHHHAGLSRAERRVVEGRFRGTEAKVLVSTSTLEMGLNLPVRQVVLYDVQTFDGSEFRPLSTNSVWQRVGRAGRPGLDPAGEAVLLAPIWDRDVVKYEQGRFEPIVSALSDPRVLAEQAVVEVASGLCRTRAQLEAVFGRSLAARQRYLPDVGATIERMLDAGILREVHERDERRGWVRLRATRLGHVATRHMLSPATVLLLRRTLEANTEFTFFDLLLIAASSPDCKPTLPVDFEELDALASDLSRERSFLLRLSRSEIAGMLGVDGRRMLSALKAALVVRAWTRLSDIHEAADSHDCYPFEVRRLCDSFERLLFAACAVLEKPKEEHRTPIDSELVSLRERLLTLRRMVSAGIDESAATLALVDGIGPVLARRLQGAGVADIEGLALAEPTDLSSVPGVSEERAGRWATAAAEIARSRSALSYREIGPVADMAPLGWPAAVDPYRLRRALDLAVVRTGDGAYTVTGGLEPHVVRRKPEGLLCDCVDAGRGNECKHRLAVQLHVGNRGLRAAIRRLSSEPAHDKLNLFDLWFDQPPTAIRGSS